jgi:hypothetical protein
MLEVPQFTGERHPPQLGSVVLGITRAGRIRLAANLMRLGYGPSKGSAKLLRRRMAKPLRSGSDNGFGFRLLRDGKARRGRQGSRRELPARRFAVFPRGTVAKHLRPRQVPWMRINERGPKPRLPSTKVARRRADIHEALSKQNARLVAARPCQTISSRSPISLDSAPCHSQQGGHGLRPFSPGAGVVNQA